jgi:hypothetical protein
MVPPSLSYPPPSLSLPAIPKAVDFAPRIGGGGGGGRARLGGGPGTAVAIAAGFNDLVLFVEWLWPGGGDGATKSGITKGSS